ncbi:MAG: aminoacyl-tRNA hydrolase [Oscillospiraceae bacterium]|nr:aminoacyl-tRNA hydrolase [Oscillospiraceae bacterium]
MFLFNKNKTSGVSWLIVGLGNPGEEYEKTRHNAGFEVVDLLAETLGVKVQRLKFKALTATAEVGEEKVLLMKPTTYMNLSGEAVEQAASFYKVPPERVLVISDEVALPPGKLRIRFSGSAGGHNGLKNIIAHLHSEQFPRIRVGVGNKPHPDYDMVDWVLGRPQGEDRKALDQAEKKAAQAIEVILKNGLERAMEKYNR